jgi:hypothetical protein
VVTEAAGLGESSAAMAIFDSSGGESREGCGGGVRGATLEISRVGEKRSRAILTELRLEYPGWTADLAYRPKSE